MLDNSTIKWLKKERSDEFFNFAKQYDQIPKDEFEKRRSEIPDELKPYTDIIFKIIPYL